MLFKVSLGIRYSILFIVVVVVLLLLCLFYYFFDSSSFYEESVPIVFQSLFNNITKCSSLNNSKQNHLPNLVGGRTFGCFTSSKEQLMIIARETFHPLAQNSFEQ